MAFNLSLSLSAFCAARAEENVWLERCYFYAILAVYAERNNVAVIVASSRSRGSRAYIRKRGFVIILLDLRASLIISRRPFELRSAHGSAH